MDTDIINRITTAIDNAMYNSYNKPTHIFMGIKQCNEFFMSEQCLQCLRLYEDEKQEIMGLILIKVGKTSYLAVGNVNELEDD